MEKPKKKSALGIIIPIIIAVIVVAIFIYLDSRRGLEPEPEPSNEPTTEEPIEALRPEPISPSQNPRREEQLDPRLGCASPLNIEPETLKEPDKEWVISREGKTIISLGKYRITAPEYLVFDIPKLWLYFFSEKLSSRDDRMYGLEKSYISKIVLIVNDYERELKLGGDEYMFIELSDFPLGDLYPYDKEVVLDFEFLIELNCNNIEKGACFNNKGEPLDFIDGADIQSQVRLFAVGCQEFSNDLMIDSIFRHK